MSDPLRLLFVIGTRPEAIKLAPVVLAAQADPQRFEARVVLTSQHREMLDPMLEEFGLTADLDLELMRPDQDLAQLTAAALEGLAGAIDRLGPDWVIVQGDTSTSFAGALAACYRQRPVAHVEAGLRTGDKTEPYPEEINRCLTARLAELHFAPTEGARANLLAEGIAAERIHVTGNTAIDALLWVRDDARRRGEVPAPTGPTLLVTAHRRESHGAPLERICQALLELVERFPELRVVYPVHLSPRVRRTVLPRLEAQPRVELLDPLGYRAFVLAMQQARVILSDSGGVQEEAPSLDVPVLVMREATERPEAVEAGAARLVGTDPARIVSEVSRLLEDPAHHARMAAAPNPFGDGRAAERILRALWREARNPGSA